MGVSEDSVIYIYIYMYVYMYVCMYVYNNHNCFEPSQFGRNIYEIHMRILHYKF